MPRNARIWLEQTPVGWLSETDEGYVFVYDADYVANPNAQPVSLTLPLTTLPYSNRVLFPFFDGLIPEGWLLDIAERNWKLRSTDRFGLLLACCRDCIGAVSVVANPENV
ncbi:HipA N-terminal domain-containing protein [Spirosoma validum]|uniref:HipA N-terminal domain-containing protein n=1 Tax=Spirosoma validum TaxID=2771355 RepID=A0A927B7C5_9BACT|nr:HipA N-terminal domain-containing protein [Spirosoma validum]MBD2756719.1 HipA N-terminal domain-containing protein [Spirosoma validum]